MESKVEQLATALGIGQKAASSFKRAVDADMARPVPYAELLEIVRQLPAPIAPAHIKAWHAEQARRPQYQEIADLLEMDLDDCLSFLTQLQATSTHFDLDQLKQFIASFTAKIDHNDIKAYIVLRNTYKKIYLEILISTTQKILDSYTINIEDIYSIWIEHKESCMNIDITIKIYSINKYLKDHNINSNIQEILSFYNQNKSLITNLRILDKLIINSPRDLSDIIGQYRLYNTLINIKSNVSIGSIINFYVSVFGNINYNAMIDILNLTTNAYKFKYQCIIYKNFSNTLDKNKLSILINTIIPIICNIPNDKDIDKFISQLSIKLLQYNFEFVNHHIIIYNKLPAKKIFINIDNRHIIYSILKTNYIDTFIHLLEDIGNIKLSYESFIGVLRKIYDFSNNKSSDYIQNELIAYYRIYSIKTHTLLNTFEIIRSYRSLELNMDFQILYQRIVQNNHSSPDQVFVYITKNIDGSIDNLDSFIRKYNINNKVLSFYKNNILSQIQNELYYYLMIIKLIFNKGISIEKILSLYKNISTDKTYKSIHSDISYIIDLSKGDLSLELSSFVSLYTITLSPIKLHSDICKKSGRTVAYTEILDFYSGRKLAIPDPDDYITAMQIPAAARPFLQPQNKEQWLGFNHIQTLRQQSVPPDTLNKLRQYAQKCVHAILHQRSYAIPSRGQAEVKLGDRLSHITGIERLRFVREGADPRGALVGLRCGAGRHIGWLEITRAGGVEGWERYEDNPAMAALVGCIVLGTYRDLVVPRVIYNEPAVYRAGGYRAGGNHTSSPRTGAPPQPRSLPREKHPLRRSLNFDSWHEAQQRAQHSVVGHQRWIGPAFRADPEKHAQARQAGVTLQPGHTWVQEHDRNRDSEYRIAMDGTDLAEAVVFSAPRESTREIERLLGWSW